MSSGISLRKRRGDKKAKNVPTISAPRQISAPMPVGAGLAAATMARPSADAAGLQPPQDAPRERPRMGDKTAEAVKRRYSQKVAQLPGDYANGPVPDLPQIPTQYRQRDQPDDVVPDGGDPGRMRLDLKALRDPNLRAEQYVSSILADASEEDIRRYQDELRRAKQRASVELQSNVYQNRTQFIKISKEAEKLKGEMRTLRQLMSDLTATLEQTASASSANGNAASSRRDKRSSIGDLNQIRAGQLQQLYRDVEGSQKYLPPIPGRYIVWKSRRWFELDSATLKARRRVRLLLLNDQLLMAVEKKPRNDIASQRDRSRAVVEYLAQRCFPLQDVQVARAPDRNAERIVIRVGAESFTYDTKAEDAGDKTTFLSTFRKTKDDLRKSQEAEFEEKDKALDAYNHMLSRDPALMQKTELLDNISDVTQENKGLNTFVDVDGQQRNIRWVDAQLDELDIEIALQHFSEAVEKVEQLKVLAKAIRGNETVKVIVTFKVNERATKLANILIKQLIGNNNWISSVRKNVDWIIRLGFEDRAREAYLEARGNLIKTRSRQCIFEGNIPDYIFQISYVYFLIIKNTVDMFQKCFPQQLMSACVKWTKEHVDQFNVLLRRQLSSVGQDGRVWEDCLEVVREHAGMLKEVGLDFSELVGRGVGEDEVVENSRGPTGLGVTV